MELKQIKALWPEKKGFHLCRTSTGEEYIFLHMHTPAEFYIDGEWVKATEGACILYDKNARQEFRSGDCPLLHDFFHLSGDLTEWMTRYGLSFGTLMYPQDDRYITEIMRSLEREFLRKADFFDDCVECRLREMFIALARSQIIRTGSGIDKETRERFFALREEIHNRFDASLSVNDMAAAAGLSPSRFYSVYKAVFGISPKKDYLNIRIEHAKSMLRAGDHTVEQVAEAVGYSNPFHFIRQFKEVVGMTPGKYQKRANG